MTIPNPQEYPDFTIARLLDANLNRAREALRVMEEYARLGLNDAALSRRAKGVRHELAALAATEALHRVIQARNIVGDVGTQIEEESEYRRETVGDIAAAAGRRLAEAMRVIEECCKTFDGALARKVERLRYEGYELERRLQLTFQGIQNFGDVRLYVIVTEAACANDWYVTAEAAIRGGADCIQLREKDLPDKELLSRACRLRWLCHDQGILFILNDRPDIAVLCEADGVHVGQDDLSVTDARSICGPRMLVGRSTHDLQQVRAAAEECPDYIALGPVYSTAIKPASQPLGTTIVQEALTLTSIPMVPVGGIDISGAEPLVALGARCACVCRAVIGADDVEAAARSIRNAIGQDAAML